MKLLTEHEIVLLLIASIESYKGDDSPGFLPLLSDIYNQVHQLNLETATLRDLMAIEGMIVVHPLICPECNREVDAVVQFKQGEEPCLCRRCLGMASVLLPKD